MDESTVGWVLHERGWRKPFTISGRVDTWAWLVGEVESGYEDLVEEYTNDLSCRDWLHEAFQLLDDDLVRVWNPQVDVLDHRFRAATVDDDGDALSNFYRLPEPDRWWWRRYPGVLTGDLGSSLRSVGATG